MQVPHMRFLLFRVGAGEDEFGQGQEGQGGEGEGRATGEGVGGVSATWAARETAAAAISTAIG